MALGDNIAVMNHQGIQQLGTPEDIYLTPVHIEIARLFGDPVINLLDVRPEQGEHGVQVRLSDQILSIDQRFASVVGKECVLGIRPESIQFVDAGTPGSFPVMVEAETPLNEKTVTLALTAKGREIMVSRPAGSPGPASGSAHVAVDLSNVLLFDRKSGVRIDAQTHFQAQAGQVA